MSRTRKGKKGVGWEPFQRPPHERRLPAPDPDADRYTEHDLLFDEESDEAWLCYMNGGCPKCKAIENDASEDHPKEI